MSVETTGSLSGAIKVFYLKQLLSRLLAKYLHNQWGQKRSIKPGSGKSVEFRRYGSLAVATTPLTEGVTPAGKNLSLTQVTANVGQYGDFVELSDVLTLTAIDPLLSETAALFGEQAGDTLDQLTRDVLAAGTNVQYAAGRAGRGSVASTDKLIATEVKKARRTLKTAKVPMFNDAGGQYYVGLVHPSATYDLTSDTEWLAMDNYSGASQQMEGEIGKCHGIRFVETENAKIFPGAGAAGIDVYATLVFGPDAYGVVDLEGMGNGISPAGGAQPQSLIPLLQFIVKQLGSGGTADPLDQRQTIGWKVSHVAKMLNDSRLLRIEHAVS